MDGGLWEGLDSLEKARDRLHDVLRSAHFSWSVAQRAEEQRGLLLGFEAIPVSPNSLHPLCTLAREEEGLSLITEASTQRPPLRGEEKAVEDSTPPVNPIYYFSIAPSRELKECQTLYQEVLRAAVEVCGLQEKLLCRLPTTPGE